MNRDEILSTLTAKIEMYQTEIDRLIVAREVIVGMVETPIKQAPPKPTFVVKRKVPTKATGRGMVRDMINNILKKRDQLSTKELTAMLFGDTPSLKEQKSVWNALTAMVKKGDLLRVGIGTYSKPGMGASHENTARLETV